MVLGSTQGADVVTDGPHRLDVAWRRSGGGAVLVESNRLVWVDLVVPVTDRLWCTDVGRATWWLGAVWARALSLLGVDGAEVHHGGLVRSAWSSVVCFAGLGPGEVTVDGLKSVGISQRRTREGALFQCALPLAWDPAPLLMALRLSDAERASITSELAELVLPVVGRAAADVEAAFLSSLPEH